MKDLLNRTIYRAKKLVVLLLLIPLITGVVAYWNESNNTPIYTAETTIELGNFENERLTNPEFVKEYLSSSDFLENVNSEAQKLEAKDIKENISISEKGKILTIKLTNEDKNDAQTALDDLTKEFIRESNGLFEKKRNFYDKKIKDVSNIDESSIKTAEEFLLQTDLLAELGIVNINIRENRIWETVSVSASYTNPLKRAVFGVILGLLVSLSIVILPEIMRKD